MLNSQNNIFATAQKSAADDSNMIPLINIVFLMLIFFMVAGKIAVKDAAPFEAPISQASTTTPVNEHQLLLAADGSLWLDGKSWGTASNLSEANWQALEKTIATTERLILKAHAQLPATLLDPVLQRLRSSGISNVQLAVQSGP